MDGMRHEPGILDHPKGVDVGLRDLDHAESFLSLESRVLFRDVFQSRLVPVDVD